MTTTEGYIELLTSQHRDRPRFAASVKASVAPFVHLQEVLWSMIPAHDVDEAIGAQLDSVGIWVGATRRVGVPISGMYFSWDTTDAEGWDNSVWKGIGDPDEGIVFLPDDLFRMLVRAKIRANRWEGDIEGAYQIIAQALGADGPVTIKDNQNMSMTVTVTPGSIPAVIQALLTGGHLPIKPAGTRAIYEVS